MCLNTFLKSSKGNNRISKSMAFHSVGAAYINDRSKNELAHIFLIGGTPINKDQRSVRVPIVIPLTLNLIKSLSTLVHYYLLHCVSKVKLKNIIMS